MCGPQQSCLACALKKKMVSIAGYLLCLTKTRHSLCYIHVHVARFVLLASIGEYGGMDIQGQLHWIVCA